MTTALTTTRRNLPLPAPVAIAEGVEGLRLSIRCYFNQSPVMGKVLLDMARKDLRAR